MVSLHHASTGCCKAVLREQRSKRSSTNSQGRSTEEMAPRLHQLFFALDIQASDFLEIVDQLMLVKCFVEIQNRAAHHCPCRKFRLIEFSNNRRSVRHEIACQCRIVAEGLETRLQELGQHC